MDATLLSAFMVVGISGVIFGMTGFGFALVSVPPLLLLYDPETVVVLTIGATILTSLVVVLSNRPALDRRLVLTLLPGAVVGLVIGARVLDVVDPTALKIAAGVFVAGYSLLLLRGYQPSGMESIWAASVAGLASGALATSTGLSAPPVVILFTARQIGVNPFRVTIAGYFVVINIIGLAVLLGGGTVGERDIVTSAWLTPAAFVGTLIGNRIVRRFSATGFRRLTVSLLLLTGITGTITALVAAI